MQFPYLLILEETLSTSDELGTIKSIHQHFSLGQFVPKLRPLGRRQCAVRRVWGCSPTSVFAAPRAAKIASVATLALLAVSVLPDSSYGFDGTYPTFLR